MVKANKVEELYLVMGKCVYTSITDLLFLNGVLRLFLQTVMVGLAGVQLSGTGEKVICVTRLNLLQDFLKVNRCLCGESM